MQFFVGIGLAAFVGGVALLLLIVLGWAVFYWVFFTPAGLVVLPLVGVLVWLGTRKRSKA